MKSIFTLICLICCSVLFAQRPRDRPATSGDPVRIIGRGITIANPKIIDGKLTIKAKQTYFVTTDLLELESLVMMDSATIRLRNPKTTLIIQSATIGRDCKIIGEGTTGKTGVNGANGSLFKAGQRKIGRSPNGRDGKKGGEGGPAKELDLYLGAIKYRAPLTISLRGGRGGRGGNGGNGVTKQAVCGKTTVGANGGNGAFGGNGGKGGLPRILFGDGVNHEAIISLELLGETGPPGKGGRAGLIKSRRCVTGFAKVKPGKAGRDATILKLFFVTNGQDAAVSTDFPYPPPKPSAMVAELPVEVPTESTLGTVQGRLRTALQSCGYEDLRYYKVPEGYAIVTGMEQVTEVGVPLAKDRWSAETNFVREFSLTDYLKSLFTARKGYFRLIVFIVTADDMLTKDTPIARSEALSWFKTGWSRLPSEIATQPFTSEHYVSALIYEFSVKENNSGAVFSEPSSLSAEAHLRGAALWKQLVSDQ